MTFTDKDKMLARKYKEAGYNYVARDNNGTLWIYVNKPYKPANSYIFIGGAQYKKVDKRNFKPVLSSDSKPTRLDDIIGE